jgi:hypothetical protein
MKLNPKFAALLSFKKDKPKAKDKPKDEPTVKTEAPDYAAAWQRAIAKCNARFS